MQPMNDNAEDAFESVNENYPLANGYVQRCRDHH